MEKYDEDKAKREYQAEISTVSNDSNQISLTTIVTETWENEIIEDSASDLLNVLNRRLLFSRSGRLVWTGTGLFAAADGLNRFVNHDFFGLLEIFVGAGFAIGSWKGFRDQIGSWQEAQRSLVEKLNSNFSRINITS